MQESALLSCLLLVHSPKACKPCLALPASYTLPGPQKYVEIFACFMGLGPLFLPTLGGLGAIYVACALDGGSPRAQVD